MTQPQTSFLTDSLAMLGSLLFAFGIVYLFLDEETLLFQSTVFLYFAIAMTEQFAHGLVTKGRLTARWHRVISPVALLLLLVLASLLDAPSENLLGFQIMGIAIARGVSQVTHRNHGKAVTILLSLVFVLAVLLTTLLPDFWVIASNPPRFVILLKIGAAAIWIQTGVTVYNYLELRNSTEDQADEAMKENEFYSKLFSLISHNLRNSLNIILSRVQLMQMIAEKDNVPPDFLRHLKPIEAGTIEAFSLVNAVLSKNKTTATHNIRVTSQEWLDQILADIDSPLDIHSRVVNDWEISQRERLAFDLSMDVFLSNSQKYGATKVMITVDKNGVTIVDNGPGVDSDRLKKLGHQKVQSKSKSGTGSGLMLANQLLGLLNWTLHIDSKENAGMTIQMLRTNGPNPSQALLEAV